MKKENQRQLQELTDTLKQANDEFLRCFEEGNIGQAMQLLIDCQECSEAMYTFIDQFQLKDVTTSNLLKNFSEYLIGNKHNLDNLDTARIIHHEVSERLSQIEISIQTDLKPTQLEVLFLPYKAAMFDAMESIWKAANDDPDCNAIVMPVPYFERASDQSFSSVCYEGELFPSYVPITKWSEYDLDGRHPDVIIIHNAYDNSNRVTCVHQEFHSHKLKNATDLLVYCPYYVATDLSDSHFWLSTGVHNADRVMVQSKREAWGFKQTYTHILRKKTENGLLEKFFNKVMPLGSPKFDKALSLKEYEYSIPSHWQDLIYRSDGSKKKIVFFNLTLGTLLTCGERIFPKLSWIFKQFIGRDDVVLLWRPHPLNVNTCSSMRIDILGRYLNLVKEYKENNWGIYDDTPDLSRAMAMSDCYYGDWGTSITPLYQCTNKPIFIQNVDVHDDSSPHQLVFDGLCCAENNIWFVSSNFNGLFKMDKDTWEPIYVASIPHQPIDKRDLYSEMIEVDGCIYFAPKSADGILKYDISANTFTITPLEQPEQISNVAYDPDNKFCNIVRRKNTLYFIPHSYPAIIKYTTTTGKITYIDKWVSQINECAVDYREGFFGGGCIGNLYLALPCRCCSSILVMHLTSQKMRMYSFDESLRFNGVCFDGENFWIAPINAKQLIKWHPDKKDVLTYGDFPEDFHTKSGVSFVNMHYADGFVWMIPQHANMSLKLNVSTKEVSVAEELMSGCNGTVTNSVFESYQNSLTPCSYTFSAMANDKIYAFSAKGNRLIEYDYSGDEVKEKTLTVQLEQDDFAALRKDALDKNPDYCHSFNDCNFYESDLLKLPDFIDFALDDVNAHKVTAVTNKQLSLRKDSISNGDGTAGKAIYAECKRLTMEGYQR